MTAPIPSAAPPRTPPHWVNRAMIRLLRTPGVERVVGRDTALLTFTGSRSGRQYSTPVSYARDEDTVVVTSHVRRVWWRNLPDRPDVGLRLAGRDHRGRARVLTGADGQAVDLLRLYLEQQRMTARALHVARDGGQLRTADLRRVLDDTVVVEITLTAP